MAVSLLLAALSGLLQVLAFPSFSFSVLAAVAVAPLLLAVARTAGWRRRFLVGWLAGAIFWGGACYWVYNVMNDYAGMAGWAAALVYLAFLLAKGLHLGVFAVLTGPLLKRPWALPAVAALWVAIEGTHQYLGFTWLHLGNAAAGMSVLAPLAPYTGVYGPSFVLAMLNVAVALALLRRPRIQLAPLAILLLAPLLPALPEDEVGEVPVRLVQPAVHPDDVMSGGWNARRADQHFSEMIERSTAVGAGSPLEPPELLIWPEYTVPFYYFDSPRHRALAETVARAVDAPFVLNTVAFQQVDGVRRPLNSAVVLSPQGELLSHYSKRFLVPFGEFVPWPFSLIIGKITLEAGDFLPGDKVVVTDLGDHEIGVYICYETVFARAVRAFTAEGAEVLINVSNDSWYGRSSARYQHLLIARMRAIENQRWILRATADGVTTVINRAGQITPPLPQFQPGVLDAYFDYRDERTWFVRFGEWFWYLCCAASIAALALVRFTSS